MPQDQTGAREASIAACSFAFLFVCMLGLLAIADAGDQAALVTGSVSAHVAAIH